VAPQQGESRALYLGDSIHPWYSLALAKGLLFPSACGDNGSDELPPLDVGLQEVIGSAAGLSLPVDLSGRRFSTVHRGAAGATAHCPARRVAADAIPRHFGPRISFCASMWRLFITQSRTITRSGATQPSETWAIGLRNPFRYAFDDYTSAL